MKILINTPCQKLLGGVANHYLGLRDFWTEKVMYNTIGKRSKNGKGILWLPWDIVKFIFKLLIFKPDIVLLNPSLGESALKRDFLFMQIACLFEFKVVVFFHGFNLEYAKRVNKKWVSDNLNKASMILVLASSFKEILRNWGVISPIQLTTTKVDDKLVEGFDIKSRLNYTPNILCVTRIEKAKGIYESLDTFHLLQQKYPDLIYSLVGDGEELPLVKEYIKKKNIKGVRITGRLDGENLKNEFKKASFFLFMSYGEGMPTCVLEAMAFGLPVFTRKVGGLVDFFKKNKMGFITDSLEPIEFADAFEMYLLDSDKFRETAFYNYNYAKQHFMASSVAKSLECILKNEIL